MNDPKPQHSKACSEQIAQKPWLEEDDWLEIESEKSNEEMSVYYWKTDSYITAYQLSQARDDEDLMLTHVEKDEKGGFQIILCGPRKWSN